MKTPNLRQALAVVFCDIVGTSQLLAREGDLVVADLLRAFLENAGRLAQEHHCRFIKFIGDGFIATLENAENALPLVFAVQTLAGVEPNMRGHHLRFRFSLHFGNVLSIDTSYGKEILGEEINTAARLNDLAEPGELVISQAALDRLPGEQQALAGPGEAVRLGSGRASPRSRSEVQIHRITLLAP